MCVSARQIKAHVVFAPSVVALSHVSVVKVLCESSVASQVIVCSSSDALLKKRYLQDRASVQTITW